MASSPAGNGIFSQNRLFAISGDEVGGKTIQNVGFPWLNNEGEVAFWAQFEDGSEAILFGTGLHGSEVVPEPSTFAPSILGLLWLGLIAWRRRRR
jgi:hypothetical protein